ncbi:MAG: hypothetical protein O3A01_04500 [bacterium]|nr:hypothetical protein [bacterium]
MIKHLFTAVVFGLVCISPTWAAQEQPLDRNDVIKPVKIVEHFVYEPYLGKNYQLHGAIGYHYDYFISKAGYIAWAVYGATVGKRGGYGIAALGYGYRHAINDDLIWDSKFLIGSGGGKDIPAHGGLATEILSGVSYRLINGIFLDVKVGYLKFPTGTFEVPVWHMGISYEYEMLSL